MNVYEQLAEAGARATYFCAHCGYEFADKPKLPVRCPQCRKTLHKFDKPIIYIQRRRRKF
jgi:predicted Zn-ribbon and HTH transcriptional regulator